jgi:ADP-ribose pyrophosphatase
MKTLSAFIRGRTPLSLGFLKLYRYEFEVERHEGGTQRLTWELMERGNTVSVLAYDPVRDEVVLGKEFRPGALVAGDSPFTEHLVSGVVSEGESGEAAAVREMQEETGLVLREPRVIHPGAYVSSGGTSEKVILVLGLVDSGRAGGVHGAEGERENILSVVLPAQEFIERARAGAINDLKTNLAAYWLAEHRRTRAPAA